jgi:hypothetical protein
MCCKVGSNGADEFAPGCGSPAFRRTLARRLDLMLRSGRVIPLLDLCHG